MNWILALFSVGAVIIHTETLSCICDRSACKDRTPKCCPSGKLTKDECGCCPACAKGEFETCGGPWNTAGNCVAGLNCLRKCDCKATVRGTKEKKDCIFPFKFKNVMYTKCTSDHLKSGRPWCAIGLTRGAVTNHKQWGYCDDECPGSKLPCDDALDLFNFEGQCVNQTLFEPKLKKKLLTYFEFDKNYATSNMDVEKCDNVDAKSVASEAPKLKLPKKATLKKFPTTVKPIIATKAPKPRIPTLKVKRLTTTAKPAIIESVATEGF